MVPEYTAGELSNDRSVVQSNHNSEYIEATNKTILTSSKASLLYFGFISMGTSILLPEGDVRQFLQRFGLLNPSFHQVGTYHLRMFSALQIS